MAYYGENAFRAWAKFDYNGAIQDSYGLSSINDLGTGVFRFNMNTTTNTNYAVYSYWDSADDCPAICEINFFHPYSSSRETIDYVNAAMVQGTRAVWQSSMNCNMNSYSVRGIQFFGSAGDSISDSNFHYLVLGANV